MSSLLGVLTGARSVFFLERIAVLVFVPRAGLMALRSNQAYSDSDYESGPGKWFVAWY
jgi:hypothetical protein